MVESLNFNTLQVDDSGRVSFSGLGSGIDFESAVDGIIAAKRIPAVTPETRTTDNDARITAYTELRTSLTALQTAYAKLRGAVSVDGAGNVFKAKNVFASTTRTDGATPSAAGNLMGVSVDNAATVGSHEVEIRRVATAHKVSSQAFTSLSTALSLSGSFSVSNGTKATSVTVTATDTLADIRDRINNANTGTSATGVTASIVSASSTEHYLVLTKDATGSDMIVTDSGSVLSGMGLSTTNGTGAVRNALASGSKIEAADGFSEILFDGSQDDNAFKITYNGTTRVMTLTRGDGTTDTATLSASTIASGSTETIRFDDFGATVVVDSTFAKGTDITLAADTSSVTLGTGVITDSTITISDSVGDISGINGSTLTFGALGTPAAISVTVGAFSGTFDGTSTGTKTVTLSDGGGNSLEVKFDVGTVFNGSETAASITLNELQNLVAADGNQYTDVLQTAQTARVTADGLVDGKHHESSIMASQTAQLSTFLTTATFPGSFTVKGTVDGTINYVASDTLQTLRDKINVEMTNTGVTAKIVADGAGFRLDLDSSSTFTLTDTNGLLDNLNVDNKLVVERESNTVADLFTGVTLTLFAAEAGTTVKLDVDRDLTAVKTDITSFVDAYNATRQIINGHNLTSLTTGLKSDDAGALFGSRTLADIQLSLSSIVGSGVGGVDTSFAALAQIGIDFVNNNTIGDPLLKDTLAIDGTTLDAALLSNPEDIRRLFGFDFSSSNSNVVLVNFTGATSFAAAGYSLNIGTFGQNHHTSDSAASATDTLDQATSYSATTSGSFTINGATVNYDVTVNTLDTLIDAINSSMNLAANGVTATKTIDSSGEFFIKLDSSQSVLTVGGDTGDLVAALNFVADTERLDSANIGGTADGASDGTVTVSGRVITVTSSSGAEGLQLLYNGPASTSGIQLDFTVGLGAQSFFAVDDFIDQTNGSIQGEIATLEGQNIFAEERIADIDERLASLRERLIARFIAMETAIASMNNILDTLRQQFEAITNAQRN